MTTYIDICKAQLRVDEGVRPKPYKDQFGNLTIAVGRDLDAEGVSNDEITLMLENDIIRAEGICRALYMLFDSLSDNRKAALINLAFNMGPGLSAFHHMNEAINNDDFATAAQQLLLSKWATQVQATRSSRLHDMLRDG